MNYISSLLCPLVKFLSVDAPRKSLLFSRERLEKGKLEKGIRIFYEKKRLVNLLRVYEAIKCPKHSFRKLRAHKVEV
jgi:hypothetical protein